MKRSDWSVQIITWCLQSCLVFDHLYLEIVRLLCQSSLFLSFCFHPRSSLSSTLANLDLCCMLCLSQRAVTYSRCHLLLVCLHLFTYFCRFYQPRSSILSSIMFPSTIFVTLPSIMLFGVKIGY